MRSKRRRLSVYNLLDCPHALDDNETNDVQLMLARFLSCIYQSGDYRILSKESGSPSDLARALNFRVVKLECILMACGLVRRNKNDKLEVNRGQMDNLLTLYDHLGEQRLNFSYRPHCNLVFRYNELVPPLCRTQDDAKDKLIKLKKIYKSLVDECVQKYGDIVSKCVSRKRSFREMATTVDGDDDIIDTNNSSHYNAPHSDETDPSKPPIYGSNFSSSSNITNNKSSNDPFQCPHIRNFLHRKYRNSYKQVAACKYLGEVGGYWNIQDDASKKAVRKRRMRASKKANDLLPILLAMTSGNLMEAIDIVSILSSVLLENADDADADTVEGRRGKIKNAGALVSALVDGANKGVKINQ